MALVQLLQQWCQELNKTTPLTTLFVYSLLLLFPLLFLLKLNSGRTKLNLPPSPPKLPIIGHLHRLGTLPHRSLRALATEYGPLMLLQLGHVPTLVVTSPEMAKEIMKTQDTVFLNRSKSWAADTFFYGSKDIGFSPHGEYWRIVRKVCVSEFWILNKVHSFKFVREEEVREMIEKITSASIDRATVNIGDLMVKITSNIISRCVLGRKYEQGLEDGKRSFGELSKTSMQLVGSFCFRDTFPSLGWMDVLTGLAKRMKETFEGFDEFLDQVIEEHRNSQGKYDQPDRECFMGTLLRLQREGTLEINLTQNDTKAILQDMFVGGTDTIATVMEWAMAELVKQPTLLKKAQEEIRRVVGKKCKVGEEDINQMDYLKCVIKESLRLHAPAPFLNPRESSTSVKLAGYDIPPKTRVFINAWAIQRDPKLWDKPEEFVPERFVNNPIDFKGHDFQFIPFGAGKRGCPGTLFGVTEVEYVLANLLYWFNWELPSGASKEDLDMSEAYGLVVHKKTPLQLVPVLHSS
ncbi:cytochrome P450 71A1-like [Cornus florida]|uniref:cytochrome P450 71A1-like n=1 Tax=Cornus florida TaxID=4283 RepID=UPI00289EF454|nr:cytochrome P450 71A1-like [Cornus florida]